MGALVAILLAEIGTVEAEVDRRYTLIMRALYLPYESPEQVRRAVEPHRIALERR
jgi:hypothetical protein